MRDPTGLHLDGLRQAHLVQRGTESSDRCSIPIGFRVEHDNPDNASLLRRFRIPSDRKP